MVSHDKKYGKYCIEKDIPSACYVCGTSKGIKQMIDGLCPRCKKEEVFLQ